MGSNFDAGFALKVLLTVGPRFGILRCIGGTVTGASVRLRHFTKEPAPHLGRKAHEVPSREEEGWGEARREGLRKRTRGGVIEGSEGGGCFWAGDRVNGGAVANSLAAGCILLVSVGEPNELGGVHVITGCSCCGKSVMLVVGEVDG